MTRILLTGARLPFSLALVRHLHAHGHQVFVADSIKNHLCRFSNAIKKSYLVPPPRFHTREFIQSLRGIVEREKIDLLLPISEEIFYIAKEKESLPGSCRVFADSYEKLVQLHNKATFIQKLKSHGLDTPKTVQILTQEDFQKIPLSPPYVIKPCYSRNSHNLVKVEKENQIPKIEIKPHNPWVAQEWIDGKRFCTYGICSKGSVLANTIYPVQYAIGRTSCLNFEAVEHEGILNWIKNFVRLEEFTGQIAFDFIETSDKLYAIECNPRTTSGIYLFGLEDTIDQAFLENTNSLITPKPGTKRQLAVGMLLYGWQTRPGDKTLISFLYKVFTDPDVVFSVDDIIPFLIQPYLLLNYVLMSVKARKTIPQAILSDLEWNGEF